MAKSKTLYEPGELDRVRKNLGDLDPEEARRVAKILGGEVGIERSPEELAPRKRRDLQRPGDVEFQDERSASRLEKSGHASSAGQERRQADAAKEDEGRELAREATLAYGQRLKMDFLCSQPDFLIKTQGQVVASFFSFLPGLKDGVNPFFLMDIVPETFKHLEALQRAARLLYPPKRADVRERLKVVPAYLRVMEILVSVDLEEISRELLVLQRNPRSIELPMLASLVRLVFYPIVRLKDAHEGFVLKEAVERAFRSVPEVDPESQKRLAEAREALLDELDYLFANVAYRWYPLLMRLCGRKRRTFSEFYDYDEGKILAFMALRREDVLPSVVLVSDKHLDSIDAKADAGVPDKAGAPGDAAAEGPKAAASAPDEGAAPVDGSPALVALPTEGTVIGDGGAAEAIRRALEIGTAPAGSEEERKEEPVILIGSEKAPASRDAPPRPVRNGLAVLESIFPESGFSRWEEHPDVYPYFNKLYSLPKGSDLIAPSDPLLQVIVLAYILNDLFHGFRSVRWGLAQDGETVDLSEGVNGILSDWISPCDEVIPKRYLPLLSEYCRLLETERESQNSTFAAKRDADLLFYKKRYFLPYTKGTIFSGLQTSRDRDLKPLYKMSPLMKRYLGIAARDVERSIESRKEGGSYSSVAMGNPFDPVHVEVDNLAIDRLRALLKHEGPSPKKLTNAALVYYALSILEVLDYLVNSPASWAYREERILPYRSLEESQGIRLGAELDAEKAFQRYLDRLIEAKKKAAAYAKQAKQSPPRSPAPESVPPSAGASTSSAGGTPPAAGAASPSSGANEA